MGPWHPDEKLPRDTQGLAVHQLCRRGLKIVFGGGRSAQSLPVRLALSATFMSR